MFALTKHKGWQGTKIILYQLENGFRQRHDATEVHRRSQGEQRNRQQGAHLAAVRVSVSENDETEEGVRTLRKTNRGPQQVNFKSREYFKRVTYDECLPHKKRSV